MNYKEGDILKIVKSGWYGPKGYPPVGRICKVTEANSFNMDGAWGGEHTVVWWNSYKKDWVEGGQGEVVCGNLVRDGNVKKLGRLDFFMSLARRKK